MCGALVHQGSIGRVHWSDRAGRPCVRPSGHPETHLTAAGRESLIATGYAAMAAMETNGAARHAGPPRWACVKGQAAAAATRTRGQKLDAMATARAALWAQPGWRERAREMMMHAQALRWASRP
jgi:hypothetical protein